MVENRQTVDSDLFIYSTYCREQCWEPPNGWFRLNRYIIARTAEISVENRQTGDSELIIILLHVLQRTMLRTAKGWFRMIYVIVHIACRDQSCRAYNKWRQNQQATEQSRIPAFVCRCIFDRLICCIVWKRFASLAAVFIIFIFYSSSFASVFAVSDSLKKNFFIFF